MSCFFMLSSHKHDNAHYQYELEYILALECLVSLHKIIQTYATFIFKDKGWHLQHSLSNLNNNLIFTRHVPCSERSPVDKVTTL